MNTTTKVCGYFTGMSSHTTCDLDVGVGSGGLHKLVFTFCSQTFGNMKRFVITD